MRLSPTHSHGHFGSPSMGKAMEPWRRWMITGIGGDTNGWTLDTLQVAGVNRLVAWLGSIGFDEQREQEWKGLRGNQ